MVVWKELAEEATKESYSAYFVNQIICQPFFKIKFEMIQNCFDIIICGIFRFNYSIANYIYFIRYLRRGFTVLKCQMYQMYFQLTPVFLCPFIEFDHFPCCHSEIHWHYCNKYASRMEKAHAKLRLKAENVSFEAQEAYKGSCRAHTTAY